MDYRTSEGDYRVPGSVVKNSNVTFTFVSEKDARIYLYNISDLSLVNVIDVPEEYRRGKVMSVSVRIPDPYSLCYRIEHDGIIEADPYSKKIIGREKWADFDRQKNSYRIYSAFSDPRFSWRGDKPIKNKSEDLIIYRLHMRGFTMNSHLPENKKGTSKGFITRIKNITDLGFNAVEFMPLYEFEELKYHSYGTVQPGGKIVEEYQKPYGINFWGYGTGNYFAPKASYFGGSDPEIRMKEMVRFLHEKNIEIIMEFSFTENTSDRMILNVIKFWRETYHIDGFRLLGENLPLKQIAGDPFLSDVRIFYDYFPEDILMKESPDFRHLFIQNDAFLYPLRKLQNHMDGSITEFANMMKRQNESYGFVNFAASSNGFTLLDAYSYSEKHNESNGEDNRDGLNYNYSHNYGVEGPTNSKNVMNERLKHMRTSLGALFMGQGIPLVQAGDLSGNTQFGNNNAYCQDNDIGWVSFSKKKMFADLKSYAKNLIHFRKSHPVLHGTRPMQMTDYKHTGFPDLSYHGREPWTVWLSDDRKSIGMLYCGAYSDMEDDDVFVCYNFYFNEEGFQLPKARAGRAWRYVSNTLKADWFDPPVSLENEDLLIVPGGSMTILVGVIEEKRTNKRSGKNK